ncbi:MAG: DUF883 domain-containing protein [Gallionella sp.]|jgi:ElaB/YqjD/DUF883 family membrane-anchored ribosome-binding protein|nr:DUF883 domain-containing protein [Gallionella sp.]
MSTKSMEEAGDISKEKLMRDLRLVVEDAEELLKATASQAGEKASAARERIQKTLDSAKARLDAAESEVIEKARQAAKATDEYVQDNPWKAVGVAACVGVIVGMLIGRSR